METLIAVQEIEIVRNKLVEARGSMSRAEAAGKLHISPQMLWLVETGQRRINNELLEKMLTVYKVSLSEIKVTP